MGKNLKAAFCTFVPAIFAGAAAYAAGSQPVVENLDEYTVASGESIRLTGYYYTDGQGVLHTGPVTNVGTLTIDGVLESYYTASALSLLDTGTILGSGELRVAASLYVSPEADMSGFTGKVSIFRDDDTRSSSIIFTNSKNSPSSASFDVFERGSLVFTNGSYTLNGDISGSGVIAARKLSNTTLADGTEIIKDATPGELTIRGDMSNFTGSFSADNNSVIRLETALADKVTFSGLTGGSLELVGAEGDARKTIEVSSVSNSTTSGNVFMYGNNAVIAQNSNDAGTLRDNGGSIYFGGRNGYVENEKVVYTFDSSTVTGNTAGNVVIGGKGAGSVLGNGAEIVVDGVDVNSITGGGVGGASANGDISITVKSGTVGTVAGAGKGAIRNGNTTVSVQGGSVKSLFGGDQAGGKIDGDINIKVSGGEVGTIYGSNYIHTSAVEGSGVNGNITIDVTGGTVNHIRGGINATSPGDASAAKQNMVLNGNVVINVGGDAKIGASDGESILGTGGSYGSVNGDVTINVSGNSTIDGLIAAGASRTDGAGVKNTYVNISGGTLNGDVYGGALKMSDVGGNTSVVISGGTLNGDVYGGGGMLSGVNGNTNITLTGDATVNGKISGGGALLGTVDGEKSFTVDSYTGDSSLKIDNFDTASVLGSSVTFAEAFTVSDLIVSSDSDVVLAEGTKFADLNIIFDSDFEAESEIAFSLSDVFGDSTGIVESALNSKESNFTVTNASGVEFTAAYEDGHINVGAAVPEPAIFAAIFGAFALAFAAYRRRM